jgi:hypothetical protein
VILSQNGSRPIFPKRLRRFLLLQDDTLFTLTEKFRRDGDPARSVCKGFGRPQKNFDDDDDDEDDPKKS